MGASHPTDTHAKALAVNLDPRRYGTFAEIGAGQEVVRHFFKAGGATLYWTEDYLFSVPQPPQTIAWQFAFQQV